MHLVVCKSDKPSKEVTENVVSILKKNKINYIQKNIKEISGKDYLKTSLVIVVGDDNTLLETIRGMGSNQKKIFAISSGQSFLTQADNSNYKDFLQQVIKGKYTVLKRARLEVQIGKKKLYGALNDIGIFPAKSASLMNYVLQLGNETLWKDTADGILISTPTGSTGYTYSVHGPIILNEPEIFVVSPVSSTERRSAVVVSNDTNIEIKEIRAQHPVAIIDGDIRVPIKENGIVIRRSKHDAIFLEFSKKKSIEYKLKQRTMPLAQGTTDLPPSCKLVYKIIAYEGKMTQKEIIEETTLPERTVRHALDILIQKNLIKKEPNLSDARQTIYSI